MAKKSNDTFATIRTEGAILPADLLRRIALGDNEIPGLRPTDYHLFAGERLGEAATRSWNRLTGAWQAFKQQMEQLPEDDAGTTLTPELLQYFPTPRDAVDYIMDTFPIVKRKDIKRTADENGENGRYITKDTILEIYDEMAQTITENTRAESEGRQPTAQYQTRLTPPPGPPGMSHALLKLIMVSSV